MMPSITSATPEWRGAGSGVIAVHRFVSGS